MASHDRASIEQNGLIDLINVAWHKVDGNAYLICSGEEHGCRAVASCVQELAAHTLPVVLDEGGSIARQFLVGLTPQAVELDSNARVKRYGNVGSSQNA